MNAEPMVRRCFRRQNPDLFGGTEVAEPSVPTALRYGPGESYAPGPVLPEEPMGQETDPECVPVD